MPFFEYIALGSQSKKIKGQIEADSISNAASRLRAQRLVVMSLGTSDSISGKNR